MNEALVEYLKCLRSFKTGGKMYKKGAKMAKCNCGGNMNTAAAKTAKVAAK